MTSGAFAKAPSRIAAIIAAEFAEMPGMRLTMAQVCRLWSLARDDAEAIVQALVERGVLTLDAAGRLCRPHDMSV